MPDSMTILLVEDNPDDAELTGIAVRRGVPANIGVAQDGEQALDYLFDEANDLPRLVVLDLRLPGIDGFEVLRRIRENERTEVTPVVILSSSDSPADIVRCYRLGANSYVRKPVDFDEFAGLIHRLGAYWLTINQWPRDSASD